MATPHLIAGAAVGRALGRPWLAWPAAFALHFVLDWIPHLDTHAMFGAGGGGPTDEEIRVGLVDFLVGSLAVIMLAWRRADRWVVMMAALLGLLIDLIELLPGIGPLYRSLPQTAHWRGFHHGIQHNVTWAEWPLGFGTQAVVIAVSVWVLLKIRPLSERRSREGVRAALTERIP